MQESKSRDISHFWLKSGKEVVLIGTAHISEESKKLVEETIEEERPDSLCVELDEGRLNALDNPTRWKQTDLRTVIKTRQLGTLLANLILSSHQKRLGNQTGVRPGEELYTAVKIAREKSIPLILSDRDIKITLRRAWRCTPWHRKFALLGGLLTSLFDKTEISEEELSKMKEQDTLNSLMEDFGKNFPEIKRVLISERDMFLAKSIRDAEGNKTLAVVGAGHCAGIKKILEEENELLPKEELETIPKGSLAWKIIGWAIPIAIVASIILLGFHAGVQKAGEVGLMWALLTGGGAMLGTIAAGAHPLTILVAFVVAPFTGLTPLIGVGFFTALAQVYVRPPRIEEMEALSDDIWKPARWWKNRVTRVFLCFLLPGVPALIGKVLAIFNIYNAF